MTDLSSSLSTLPDIFGDLRRRWGWMLALGVLLTVLGFVGLGLAWSLTLVSVLVFGVLIGVGGLAQLYQATRAKGWRSVLGHVAIGALYLVAAAILLLHPAEGSSILTLCLAGVIGAVGVVRLVMAVQHRGQRGAVWLALGGLVALALAVWVITTWPASTLWLIGTLVAVELIFNGWACIFVALAARESRPPGAVR